MSLRGGGREAIEDTPVTGAKTWDWLCDYCEAAIDEESDAVTRMEMRALLDPARAVLNGGIKAEDVLNAEQRAAIGRAAQFMDGDTETYGDDIDWESAVATLRAIADGGTA